MSKSTPAPAPAKKPKLRLRNLERKKTTLKSPWDPEPFKVKEIKGTQVIGEREGEEKTRNVLKWKLLKERPEELKRKKKVEEKRKEDEDWLQELDINQLMRPRQVPREPQPQVEGGGRGEDWRQEEENGPMEGRPAEPTYEETFQRQVEGLGGNRKRRQPARYGEAGTSGGSRDSPRTRDSPRNRRRRQSDARHGRTRTGEPEHFRLPLGQYIRKELIEGDAEDSD